MRLGQVVVGTDFQADDAIDVFHLGGEHDDRRRVVGGAQSPADRQAVFAGQHQIQHDQVDGLSRLQPVQRLGVLGQQHLEPFLGEVAPQQVSDAGIVVVDDDDTVRAGVGVGAHLDLLVGAASSGQICNSGIVQAEKGRSRRTDPLLQMLRHLPSGRQKGPKRP
jgi:hypothetical protein